MLFQMLTCCGCLSLSTGCYIIAAYNMILVCFKPWFVTWECYEGAFIISIMYYLTMFLAEIIFDTCLVYGVCNKKYRLLDLYCTFTVMKMLQFGHYYQQTARNLYTKSLYGDSLLFTVMFIAELVASIFSMLIVKSTGLEIRDGILQILENEAYVSMQEATF